MIIEGQLWIVTHVCTWVCSVLDRVPHRSKVLMLEESCLVYGIVLAVRDRYRRVASDFQPLRCNSCRVLYRDPGDARPLLRCSSRSTFFIAPYIALAVPT